MIGKTTIKLLKLWSGRLIVYYFKVLCIFIQKKKKVLDLVGFSKNFKYC